MGTTQGKLNIRINSLGGIAMSHRMACFVFMFWLATAGISPASTTFKTLVDFDGTNGNNPNHTALIQATDGNLWGNTVSGGAKGDGTVFKISPAGELTTVYSFCSLANCADGENPYTALVQASNGDFYGTTWAGGAHGYGTVFKLTPSGTLTTLYSFCSKTNCTDGSGPEGVLAQDSAGNLYGTTYYGGSSNDGTVFKLTPAGVLTTLHSFSGTDGANPAGGVISVSGVFYGTTYYGGTDNDGAVFKITGTGAFTTLHSFVYTDGERPNGWMVNVGGNFYGTAAYGGANGYGTVFEMTPAGTVTTLHSFCSASCTDGAIPAAGLMQATDGNLYGLTYTGGGTYDSGTAWELSLKGVLTVLHAFDGNDGNAPQGGLVQDTNGDFYGMTSGGGADKDGTVFSIATGLKAFVTLESTSGTVGSKVGILGDGFDSASEVKFNGVKATSTLTEAGLLTATVPAGATDGYVTVTTGTTTLASSQTFIVHNTWSKGAAMPTAVQGAATGVINGKIYVVGGATNTETVALNQIYNPATNTWATGAAMPTARWVSAGAVVNGVLYVIGGNPSNSQTNVVEAYDPSTNKWTTEAAMPTARDSISAVVENGIIYVIGGYADGSGRLTTVESYNPATNKWTEEAPLELGKSEPAAGLLGSTIVVADGLTDSGVTGNNEGYNATKNSWSTLTSDPEPRQAPCSASVSGLLYSAGGTNGSPLTVNESFNDATDKWTTLAPMPEAVVVATGATVNNQLYCFGGSNNGAPFAGTVFNYVQIYQP